MGTRGLFGFRWKGVYYMMYNHWDSYPTGLGKKLIEELLKAVLKEWFRMFRRLRFINQEKEEDDVPQEEDIQKLSKWTDLGVDQCSTQSWYCLTRKCQGSMEAVLESGYMLLHGEYKHPSEWSSIFIEWAYVVNFDNGMFEWFDGSYLLGSVRLNRIPPGLFSEGVVYNEDEEEIEKFSDSMIENSEEAD